MDNLQEKDTFLEIYNVPKLNQEEIENMNRPVTSMATETLIKKKKRSSNKRKPRTRQLHRSTKNLEKS